MYRMILVFATVLIVAGSVGARTELETPTKELRGPSRANVLFWYDDIESGEGSWTHVDNTATSTPHFHVDTYLAYEGTYSWWCGTFDYDTDGGYGNSWDDRLVLPGTDVSGAYYPILTYAFRHDSEPAYDFTYVQAESNGVYVNLNRGYDGSANWSDIGDYGFVMSPYDNPIQARFRFISDGAWSDSDGLYDSFAGAFMCDNIKIFDFYGGYVYFLDDVESGGLCTPAVPAAAGDYWHIIDRRCPAASDPHSWWCGDDGDTSLIPPNLDNSLTTPYVDLDALDAVTCTVRFYLHSEVPTVDNDYWTYYGTIDGGTTWVGIASFWGDFGQCDGWGSTGIDGLDLGFNCGGPPFGDTAFQVRFFTTDNGCGPGSAGGAGIMLDDTWLEGLDESPVDETSWGAIKSFFR
ncbi:MAG: hypothetical protein GF405_03445 [Candidatus Eisenbacteria bacterium]|nr:hypothetical protein [Candidatus Eisenbacteria bacterium]